LADIHLLWPVPDDVPLNDQNPFGASPELYAPIGYAGHPGCDFSATKGTDVTACDGGPVVLARLFGTAGNAVRIHHEYGDTRYCHLSELLVAEGDTVERGQLIGRSGGRPGEPGSGYTTGEHLHLDFWLDGEPADNGYGGREDPAPYLVHRESETPAEPSEPD